MIETTIDVVGQQRLAEFINKIGEVLNNKCRRASFATYALGLLGDSERKSMEPIAARDCADPHHADAAHQRLQHFITSSTWSDRDVRRIAVQYGLAAVKTWDPVRAWIIDDTGFLKKGYHSVGVQRQYTGSAGKVTNCQIGVNLTIATNTRHLPIDFELYLPKCWTDDPDRRREAQIPAEIQFRTKPQLALEMLQRAVEDDLPRGIVLGDTAYGNACWFRTAVRDLGLDYALSVQADTKVWQLDSLLRRRGSPLSIRELMQELASQKGKKGFRRITWREGTKTKLSARFAVRRVVPYHDDGDDPSVREDVWLLMEWENGKPEPTKFYLITLPRNCTKKRLVRTVKQRWRIERVFQDFKGELGLDHFEGRRYRGWHHHVSVALCIYAFVAAEQARLFPPSARTKMEDHAQFIAA